MKNVILPIVLIFLSSCSVEKDEINESQILVSNLNAIVEIEGCEVESYNFDNVGKIEVTNDTEKLYITIAATSENFDLVNSKLHIAISESDFPTVGRGNLPPSKMEYNMDFESNVRSHTFEFPLDDFEGCIYIASQSTFSNGEDLITSWVGDINLKNGNWSYFQYCIQECIPTCEDLYTGPAFLTGSITYNEAKATISGVEAATKLLYANLIIQTGEYFGSGLYDPTRYSPSITSLVSLFNSELNEPFETYDLKTTFSYGDDECAGTIDLIITVIDDRDN